MNQQTAEERKSKYLNVGDLVRGRPFGGIGVVVDKRLSNQGLEYSMHARHLLKLYDHVYYVYFSGRGVSGPYYGFDLMLTQSCQTMTSIDL